MRKQKGGFWEKRCYDFIWPATISYGSRVLVKDGFQRADLPDKAAIAAWFGKSSADRTAIAVRVENPAIVPQSRVSRRRLKPCQCSSKTAILEVPD